MTSHETDSSNLAAAFQATTNYEAYILMPQEMRDVLDVVRDATRRVAIGVLGHDATKLNVSETDQYLSRAEASQSMAGIKVAYNSAMYGHSQHAQLIVADREHAVELTYSDDIDAFQGVDDIAVYDGPSIYEQLGENKVYRLGSEHKAAKSVRVTNYHNPTSSTEVRTFDATADTETSDKTELTVATDIVEVAREMLDKLRKAHNEQSEDAPAEVSQEQLDAQTRRLRAAEMIASLDEETKIEVTVQLLNDLSDGFKPYPIFIAGIEKFGAQTVEMVPFRTNPETGKTEVLLTQRPEGDPWAGEWHVPGGAILPMDLKNPDPTAATPYQKSFGRLLNADGELKAGVKPTFWPPVELRTEARDTRRSTEVSVVHYVEVEGEPTVGQFVPVGETIETELPVIDHHVQFIIDAARDYEKRRAEQRASRAQDGYFNQS